MYSPDERRSIRAEQNRDAMPSEEEAARMARNNLASEGCQKCDEDDPDNLSHRMILMPSCPAAQAPPDPRVVMCDDCHEDRDTLRERAFSKARKRNDSDLHENKVVGVAFYECGGWNYVEAEPFDDDPRGDTIYYDAHPHWVPTAEVRCRCGADIDEYVALSEVDE
jgi:hypothetical protein